MKTGREENGNRREGSSVGTGGVDQRAKSKEEPGKSKEDNEWKGR